MRYVFFEIRTKFLRIIWVDFGREVDDTVIAVQCWH